MRSGETRGSACEEAAWTHSAEEWTAGCAGNEACEREKLIWELREVQHRDFPRVLAGVWGERDNLSGKFSEKCCERCNYEAVVDVVLFSVNRLLKVLWLVYKTYCYENLLFITKNYANQCLSLHWLVLRLNKISM